MMTLRAALEAERAARLAAEDLEALRAKGVLDEDGKPKDMPPRGKPKVGLDVRCGRCRGAGLLGTGYGGFGARECPDCGGSGWRVAECWPG